MPFRSCQRAATQDDLIDHELAVVFAKRPLHRPVARIRRVRTLRPLPDNAEGIGQFARARRNFPFGLAWQTVTPPTGEGVGFVVTDVADWRRSINGLETGKRHREPLSVDLPPITRRFPSLRFHCRPTVR